MKKIYIFSLLVGLLAMTSNAQAVNYDLYIAGVQVTDANKGNITGAGISGSVKFDSANEILTLTNATISSATQKGIESYIDGLTINLVGKNKITCTGDYGVLLYSNATIQGSSGSLEVSGKDEDITNFLDLQIKNTTIITSNTGASKGVKGTDNSISTLTINNATIKGGEVGFYKKITLTNCHVAYPSTATLSTSKGYFENNGNYVNSITINPGSPYNLIIADTRVSAANAGDILGDGKVSYVNSTKTLTLNNATITAPTNTNGIKNEIDGLKISLVGTNNVSASGSYAAINLNSTTTITGNGTLTASSFSGITLNGNLTIENTTVTATGTRYGIRGISTTETLTIKNSTVKATGTEYGSIYNLKSLVLDGCEITSPAGAAFSETLGGVAKDGVLVKTQVTITPEEVEEYDLKVGDVKITSANKDNITAAVNADGHGTASGTITYNPETNTLTLNNANITEPTNTNGVESQIDGLKISLVGINNIKSRHNGIKSEGNLSISGGGALNLEGDNYISSCGILADNSNLTIENVTIIASGYYYGICGLDGSTEILTIKNSTVKATGTVGSICDIKSLVLDGCAITSPSGAAFSETLHGVAKDGVLVTEEVVIEPYEEYDLAVAGVTVTKSNKDDITAAVVAAGKTASGTITYNNSTNTLTLNNANLGGESEKISIYSSVDNLTIELVGTNTIKGNALGGMSMIGASKNDFTITGSGSLYIESDADGIRNAFGNITIDNTTVTIKADNYGICGGPELGYDCKTLTIKNSTVNYIPKTSNGLAFSAFQWVTLEGCAVTQPSGAKVIGRTIMLAGEEVEGKSVTIAPVSGLTSYDLWVGGIQVNSANASNILGDGKVSYNNSTKTLTLNNANISTKGMESILNKIEGLKIYVKGTNTIEADYRYWQHTMYSEKDFSIVGNGSLELIDTIGYQQIVAETCNLTIEDVTLKANGIVVTSLFGIGGDLTIKNATVRSKINASNIVLDDCAITSPSNAIIYKGVIIADDKEVTDEVVIEPIEEYDFKVAGVQINENNASNITAAINNVHILELESEYDTRSASGTITYNPETNTLTLDNATISTSVIHSITSWQALGIELKGTNKFEVTLENHTSGIVSEAGNLLITGSGSLTIESVGNGIIVSDNLLIDNTTVTVKCDNYGITKRSIKEECDEVVTIKNSTVKITGNYGSILDLKSLDLDGCAITSPAGAAFSEMLHGVAKDGVLVTEEVVIEPYEEYDLAVAGVTVTKSNKDDITAAIVAEGKTATGKIYYSDKRETLILENATIELAEGDFQHAIYSGMEDLTIAINGVSCLKTISNDAIRLTAGTLIITDTASTNTHTVNRLEVRTEASKAIYSSQHYLYISYVDVIAVGAEYGIAGWNGENDILFIDGKTTVRATGKGQGSIAKFKTFYLDEELMIHQPDGAAYDETLGGIALNGALVTDEVVISPKTTAIENVESDAKIFAREGRIFGAENARIYDILGRDVTRMNGSLKGVFVVKTTNAATKIIVR